MVGRDCRGDKASIQTVSITLVLRRRRGMRGEREWKGRSWNSRGREGREERGGRREDSQKSIGGGGGEGEGAEE